MIGIPHVINIVLIYNCLILALVFLFAIYDIRNRKVLNITLLYFLPVSLCSVIINYIFGSTPLLQLLINSITGFLFSGLILLLLSLITGGGLGGGDIKLSALLGIIYGIKGMIFILMSASILTLITGLFIMLLKRKKEINLPFVPFICLGCITYFILNIF